MGQARAAERKNPYQVVETKNAGGSKREGQGEPGFGPVYYDAQQGTWVRLESPATPQKSEERSDSNPTAPFGTPEADQPRKTAEHESGSLLKWSSWFRTEIEGRRTLVTPPPEEAPEPVPQLPDEIQPDPEVCPPAHAQNQAELEATSTLPDESAPILASVPAPVPETAVPESETDAVHPTASVEPQQLVPRRYLGGIVWKSSTDTNEAVLKAATAPAESLKAVPWQDTHARATPFGEGISAEIPKNGYDQDAPRWFVLKGILSGAAAPQGDSLRAPTANVPVLQVFYLSGGVGKTSLVATLGRALSARGERVLLVEATDLGSLPYFFGCCNSQSGVPRTFRPPTSSTDTPIRVATVSPEAAVAQDGPTQSSLASDIQGWAQGANRVIVDVATRSSETIRALARVSPRVLVPLVPDVRSVLTVDAIDALFKSELGPSGSVPVIHYLLNQFDPSLPLHMEVRKILRDKLGDRLLPFELQRAAAIGEALADGMTIIDYAPDSPAVGAFVCLAKWLQEISPSTDGRSRDRRWSEQ